MKSALIIGGSRGLGLGLAGELLARGWRVTATVRTPSSGLDALASRSSGRLTVETADINAPASVSALGNRLSGNAYDLLFLNAGIMTGRDRSLAEVPDADIIGIVMTNAISPIRAADELLPLAARSATIAFMSSVLGSIATNEDGRTELYRASKAALNSLVRSFRARHAKRDDLTVLAIHPGWVRTAMGGPAAAIDIETSVKGVSDVIAKRAGSGGTAFVDYRNEIIPW
jgi:NAD(P)-dependent dehydrogenase (short-subunit alcohol dehydrogenase family)